MFAFILSISLIISVKSTVKCSGNFYEEFDVVHFEVLEHRVRRKPSDNVHFNSSRNRVDIEIEFTSFRKNFNLLLIEDLSFHEIPVNLYHSNTSKRNPHDSRVKFYDGYLRDKSMESYVLGYMLDGYFTGTINDAGTTYFVQPATLNLNSHQESPKILVYRDVDLYPLQWNIFSRNFKDFPYWRLLHRKANVSGYERTENSGVDVSNITDNVFCEVEIVADHTLFTFFQNDTDKLTAILYLHAKFADYIFRKSDFSMDGKPDGVRIGVGKISIYKSAEDGNYPMAEAYDITDYLNLLIFRKQSNTFCLSIALTYRNYEGTTIGEAFKAETRFFESFGGICDRPMSLTNNLSPIYFNTGVINMQFLNRSLPLAISMVAFAHEIAHGFGSDHDPADDPVCSPGESSNYLMHPNVVFGSPNSMKLSPCSREDIWKTVVAKGACLQYREPECGNGVREGEEKCDCGSKLYCDMIDACCVPSDAEPPHKGCTFRAGGSYQCSPKEDFCCTENCTVLRDQLMPCYIDETRCLYSFCDGMSAVCPEPKKMAEMCRPKFSCDNETCVSSTLCSAQGLRDCLCKGNTTTQCLQCCEKDGDCVPASDLGVVHSSGKPYILKTGTTCNDRNYRCDVSGNCVLSVTPPHTSKSLYFSIIVVPFIVSIFLLIAMFVSCQNSDRHLGAVVRPES